MPKLVLLRHAKSAWPDVPDHQRPLGPRGRRDAPAAGRWIRQAGYLPDLVLCSTARRTRETWQLAQKEMGWTGPVRFEDGIYQATAATLLQLVRQTPAEVTTLLVVGHDPAIPQLALMLAGQVGAADQDNDPDRQSERPDPLKQIQDKFPTAAVAVLRLGETAWAQLSPGQTMLLEFIIPREISPRS